MYFLNKKFWKFENVYKLLLILQMSYSFYLLNFNLFRACNYVPYKSFENTWIQA